MFAEIKSLQNDYEEKKEEINSFFDFVRELDTKQKRPQKDPSLKLLDLTVLKADCLLVLYNIVEPTVDSLAEVLLRESKEHTQYTNLHRRIRNIWLTQQKEGIRKCSDENAIKRIESIIDICSNGRLIDISVESFVLANKEKSSYGFSTICHIFECFNTKLNCSKSADSLNQLCEKRNQLAHGKRRYHDVGAEITVQDLEKIKKNCYQILDSLFAHSNKIIEEKRYVKKN